MEGRLMRDTKWLLMISLLFAGSSSGAAVAQLRLYALDCGHATFKDMGGFSDTGEYDGKAGEIAAPCFLIRHPKGNLLWDAGFGDGTVMILRAPGHTPGHQVLKLKLQKSGTVILSGDLYHLRTSREFRRVPVYNSNRADTLASMSRVETIIKNTAGRLIVQHDPHDYDALPKPPAYLD
jgi:hypothetical protein